MTVAEAIAKLSTLPQDARMMDIFRDEFFEIKDYVYRDWGNPNDPDRGGLSRMKVKDLIEALEKCDDDYEVYASDTMTGEYQVFKLCSVMRTGDIVILS